MKIPKMNYAPRTRRLHSHWLITVLTLALVFSPLWMLSII